MARKKSDATDAAKAIKKVDDLSAPHLEWLIQSRMRNQNACLRLFNIFEAHSDRARNIEFRAHSQNLVSVGFSLWRAAFLADKTGQREAVFADARAFLAQLLTNNAINYPQDRAAREWTFNYYMTNAKNSLLEIAEKWVFVATVLSKYEKVAKGTTNSRRRWNRHQNAFEAALDVYEEALTATLGARRVESHPKSK